MTTTTLFVLTFEYSDKSGFKVCGVTANENTAKAWMNSGCTLEHKVYALELDDLRSMTVGHDPL